MPKVKITKLPKGSTPKMYGDHTPPQDNTATPNVGSYMGGNSPEIKINETLQPTSREHATLEAEKGETVVTNLQGEGIPEFYKIAGKPHSKGGTPLNLPENSFIFSKDKRLAIKDPEVLKMFGKTDKKGKYTPAELSKSFNLNKYREVLANPFTDKLQRETAEKMIQNYNVKLGKLALVQESMKGFDNGIPQIAMGYLEHIGMPPEEVLGEEGVQQQARYGLETFQGGGNTSAPNKKRKIRITNLPKYQKAGETPGPKQGEEYHEYNRRIGNIVPTQFSRMFWDGQNWVPELNPQNNSKVPATSSRTTAVQNIPKGAVKWDPTAEGYKPEDIRENDYVKNKNGRYERVTGFRKPKYEGETIERLGDLGGDFGLLKEKFQDEKFRAAFVAKYRDALSKAKPNDQTDLTQADIDAALNMEPDEIINNFLKKEEINYAIHNEYGMLSDLDKKDLWDKNRNLANETAAKLGYDPMDKVQITAFQAGYIGLNDLSKDPEYKDMMKDFELGQAGRFDESVAGTAEKSISQIDGWDGNTTSGELVVPRASEMITEDVEDKKVEEQQIEHMQRTIRPRDPGLWWTQDLVNLGVGLHSAATRPERKPWVAPLQYREATPTFTRFEGAAGRLQSGLDSAARVAGQNMGPQQLGATLLAMNAQMAPGILQLQEQENATNIRTANQFELANTQMFNQFARDEQQRKTGEYAGAEAAKLQDYYDKRRDREMLATLFNQGWTNKGKTKTLNELHPDFAVDPITGYLVNDPSYRNIPPSSGSQTDMLDDYASYKERQPDLTIEDYYKLKQLEGKTAAPAAGTMDAMVAPQNYPGNPYAFGAPGTGLPRGSKRPIQRRG